MDEYRVQLPEFHGPLDLLLHLVKKNELDVRDISLSTVTEQFLSHLEVLRTIDVEQVGDFIVVAATLTEIKSRMVLPRAESVAVEETITEIGQDLVRQLLEYRRFKQAAAQLDARAADRELHLTRGGAGDADERPATAGIQAVELWDLVSAFGRILQESGALEAHEVVLDDTPQSVYREQVLHRVRAAHRLAFRQLFLPPYHRIRLVGLFLAVLELIKIGAINLEQTEVFADIWLVFIADVHQSDALNH